MARDAEKLAAQGARIKQLRDQARISQEAAARGVDVSTRAFREWEAGRSGIETENLRNLADFLGTTPDFIEYGVIKREAGETPDPFAAAPDLDAILARLSAIEQKLDLVLAMTGTDPEKAEDFGMLVRRELERAMGLSAREVGTPPRAAVRGTRREAARPRERAS